MGGKVQQKKTKLVPRAVPSAAASLMFQEKTAHSTKQDGTSLFSAAKRKYPFKDISIQVMAGGKWPSFQKCAMVITGEPGPSPLIIKESQLSSVGRGHNQSNLANHIGEFQPGHLPLLWCFSGAPQLLKSGKCSIIVELWRLTRQRFSFFEVISSVLLICSGLLYLGNIAESMTCVPKSSEMTRQKRCPHLLVREMLWFFKLSSWLRL